MMTAWRRVVSNKTAAGIDKMRADDLKSPAYRIDPNAPPR
jgi:hypothetical protein